ncbi:MAG: indolepyruvate ferredoxin oxidoreductase subunit alpha, partial [Lachnospiraceae bacterium]|nr:indolepyruvate ferredoxin oxidoreductase subunit alpha [Lachnospiraceae bacterium]
MGNGAIAYGALKAGVNLVSGYPGTPSSEIVETVAKAKPEGVHVEWSVNEKAAMEVAAAASYSGARTLVTMKQVGLNVASDPLMSLAYVGVKGGMVVVSADDPGPISSQTEQDTRRFAEFARIPVFDPSSPEEAYEMIQDAYECSEKYATPVLFRPTTRVDHAYAAIDRPEKFSPQRVSGFIKNSKKWVIFPRLSFANHAMIEKRNVEIGEEFSLYRYNTVEGGNSEKAVVASGISYAYAKEFLKDYPEVKLIRIGTPYPFPESFVKKALEGVTEVLSLEELSPYNEEQIARLCGRNGILLSIRGKLTGDVPASGELSTNLIAGILRKYLELSGEASEIDVSDAPELPVRPPVLCAGCPHRASFYAVKKAMKGRNCYFCGDIGCYTLGNAMPLDMCDTCLCMGAGITMAQGFTWMDKEGIGFAFVGDSTFFASGMTGVVNAVYNNANMILCVLDNSTTAMTGHQPHP